MSAGRWLGAVALAASIALGSPPAVAQKPSAASKKQNDKKARELYLTGDKAYAEGRYEDALRAFQEAYELSGRPGLLYNMGNAFERLGRPAEAAATLDEYLPHAKSSEREIIQKRVENLKKRAEEEEAERLEREARGNERALEPPPKEPAPSKPEPGEPAASSNTLPWLLIGGGGVLIVGGAVAGVLALDARSEADSGCTDSGGKRLCSGAARDAIDRDQQLSLIADVGFVVGAVVSGIGVYLLLDSKDEQPPGTARRAGVRTSARPGGGELQIVTTF